jgi:hypothetical protein
MSVNGFKTLVASALLLPAIFLSGQTTNPAAPPHFIKMTKMEVKLGKLSELRKLEAERTAVLRASNFPRSYITQYSITGPQLVWVFYKYDNDADIANDLDFIDGNPALKAKLDKIETEEAPLLMSKREVTIGYHPDISYRPDVDWSEIRYWEIIWVHLRNGHHEAYVENRKMTREEHERGAFDTHQMIYMIQSGEMSGTFFIMRPMKTLALLDGLHAANDGEPATKEEETKKIALFADSSVTEEEAFFKVDLDACYLAK